MYRKLLLLPILMVVCLVLLRDRAPVALSVPTPSSASTYVDDGCCLPGEATFERLAKEDPVKFLDACLRRYNREIHGYSGVLHKQERIDGKLYPPEVIDFWFAENPYSVLMKWKQGARLVCATLYVEGDNDNNALVLPTLLKWSGKVVEHDPEGRLAKQSARYTMREFSLRQGTERAHKAWQAAQQHGALKVEYKGIQTVPELNGRKCHVLKRTCTPAEEDGLVYLEVMIDVDSWLQLGSRLTDADGNLIAYYFFPDIHVNPDFSKDQFTKESLRK
jgi:hypothetical protein